MRNSIKPIIKIETIKPINKGKSGNSQINDPGVTFNESGVTFNQTGLTFGGLYGFTSGIKPSISNVLNITSSVQSQSRNGQSMGLLLALTYTN